MAKRVLDSLPRSKGAGKLPPGPRKKPRQTPVAIRVIISLVAEEWICEMIRGWRGKTMTWEAIRAKANSKFESEWTRQALFGHKKIKKAYRDTKKRLREDRDTEGPRRKTVTRNSTIPVFQDRIRFLEDKVIELERTILEYQAQFARWQQNAYLAGIPLSKLDDRKEPGDRGKSEK